MTKVKAYEPGAPHWSLMTKSRGGVVSVSKGLTYAEVCRMYEALDPHKGEKHEVFAVHDDFKDKDATSDPDWSGHRSNNTWAFAPRDGDIEMRHVFGPPGWDGFEAGDVNYWPKLVTIFTDAQGKILGDEYQEDAFAARLAGSRLEARKAHKERLRRMGLPRQAVVRPEKPAEPSDVAVALTNPVVVVFSIAMLMVIAGYVFQ